MMSVSVAIFRGTGKNANCSAASFGKVAENVLTLRHAKDLGAFSALMPQTWLLHSEEKDPKSTVDTFYRL
jgi:hypothetical protein